MRSLHVFGARWIKPQDLLIATSEPAVNRTAPPLSEEAPDLARIAAIAKAYGNELLG
jgi:hypothetical protein